MMQLRTRQADRTAARRTSGAAGRRGPLRPGFTLLEALVAVGIIIVLVSLTMLGGRAVHEAMRKSSVQQQLRLIASAIDAYASFWPKWEFNGVLVAERGWPDPFPSRLFAATPAGPFDLHQDADSTVFNDPSHLTFTLDANDAASGIEINPTSREMTIHKGDVEFAMECLAYCLSSTAGKGPHLTEEAAANLVNAHDEGVLSETYPVVMGSGGTSIRKELVDPWGTPIRYFWVRRDLRTNVSDRDKPYRGYLPVSYAAWYWTDGSVVFDNTQHPDFWIDTDGDGTPDAPQTAVGFVLESAGPDKRFGNVWQPRVDAERRDLDVRDAEDNIIYMP